LTMFNGWFGLGHGGRRRHGPRLSLGVDSMLPA
jgi:hypothetical protein